MDRNVKVSVKLLQPLTSLQAPPTQTTNQRTQTGSFVSVKTTGPDENCKDSTITVLSMLMSKKFKQTAEDFLSRLCRLDEDDCRLR